MLNIDGSQGEGGGQVLRTSLSLSAITGKSFRIENIRANRSRPGLRPQHLTSVHAVAALCEASLEGNKPESTTLVFRPGSAPKAGSYRFDVSRAAPGGFSAGSVTLIFQALLWPLLFADQPSDITLLGGTFVPFSPPYHYLSDVFQPATEDLGAVFETSLVSFGWMSDGGGEMKAVVWPSQGLRGVHFQRGSRPTIKGVAAVTNLPSHIPHRMARRAHNLLSQRGIEADIRPIREKGAGPGAGIVLTMDQAGSSSLGRKGLPADKVAEAAVAGLISFIDNGAAVDYHLADQLLIPMALAQGQSTLTTDRLTRHVMTNIALLRQWLNVDISVLGTIGEPGKITINGVNYHRS